MDEPGGNLSLFAFYAAAVGFAVLSLVLPRCFSPRVIICNVVQHIKQRNCFNVTSPNRTTRSNYKTKARRKRSNQGKEAKKTDEGADKRNPVGKTSTDKQVLRNGLINQSRNQGIPSKAGVSHHILTPPHDATTLNKLDEVARNRELFATQKAREPFTFKLDEYGGFVDAPYLKLLFLYGAVTKNIEITVTPRYQWEKENAACEKLQMTPEIFFTSKDKMKFYRPVEVQLVTPYTASKKKDPVNVQIERTEHCTPPNWLKIDEVEFHKGMIKFFMNQFCGIRAVCNSCQRSIISTRISYSLSVLDSTSLSETERNFYLRLYTDTPDQHEQVLQEMEQDGHTRIHPTQKYTVRHGCKLMAHLSSPDLHSSPSFELVEMRDDIIMEAYIFNLKSIHGSSITTSDLSIEAHISEIMSLKTTRMSYNPATASTLPRNVQINITGGTGVQANINVGNVTQENLAFAAATTDSEVSTVPKVAFSPVSLAAVPSSGSTFGMTPRVPTNREVYLPDYSAIPQTPLNVSPLNSNFTVPKIPYVPNPNFQPTSPQNPLNAQTPNPHCSTTPKVPYIPHPDPERNFFTQHSTPEESTAPKSYFTPGGLQMPPSAPQMPHSVLIRPAPTSRVFTVDPVPETDPKRPWTPQDQNYHATFRHSSPYGFQNPHEINGPSPIPNSGNFRRRLSSSSSPNPAFSVSDSHPSYTQTVGRPNFYNRRDSFIPPSAFYRLGRNSSHPSLVSLDFQPLPFNPPEVSNEVPGAHDVLSSLPEEIQEMVAPCGTNSCYNDEVFEALANVESLKHTPNQENQSSATRGTQVNPPQDSRNTSQERPSAVSSGFGSGFTTRNTSACTDVLYEECDVMEKQTPSSPTKAKSRDLIRPRSVSDPRELAAKLGKVREQATKVSQSTQTAPKKTYSDVLKMPSKNGAQLPKGQRSFYPPTRIPRLKKKVESRTGRRSKKC